ncbi:MAG: cell wall anchor protein [Corynebacterium sp.]|uniref:cell wall anchor protein n=1 Tax=Corynebacterium sp. TaxID=1720 RepID=UPI0026DD6FE7|nr:cell wall anchor protein [Corynebacterium sp.]MDO5029249.1 cell wall anchor protein [Corynebacterium sp.]
MSRTQNNSADKATASTGKKKAGAFDIRNVIGALIGLYGIILLLSWLFLDPGVNPETNVAKEPMYNLYSGVALVVFAIVFFVWAKLRPTVVEES